jgi:hypothetical protein
LVVLGAPGAGKTALAMLLTVGIAGRRQADEPVPVLLGIASWNPTVETVAAFVARRLAEDDQQLAASDPSGRSLAERLVATGRILAVLDGLDELPAQWQAAAMEAIEVYGAGRGVVLTCRAAEYETAVERRGSVLSQAAVIEIQPVGPEDVITFLTKATLSTERWRGVFDELRREPDGALAQVLSTPLMVGFAQTAFAGPRSEPAVLLRRPDQAQITGEIIDRFVARSYQVDTPMPGGPDRAARYLGCLAYHLYQAGTRDFAWWRLSPTMFSLSPDRRVWLGSAVTAVATSLAATAGSFTGGPELALRFGIVAAIVVGAHSAGLFGTAWPTTYPPQPVAPYGSWRRRAGFRYAVRFAFGLLTGCLVGLLCSSWIIGVLGGAACGLLLLPGAWMPRPPSRVASARLTLLVNRRGTTAIGAEVGLVAAAVFLALAAALPTTSPPLVVAAVAGLMFAGNAALAAGLWTWLWFRMAHLLLAARGWLPLRLWPFLEDALDRGTLRQAGPVLQFRHALLQDHLAEGVRLRYLMARAHAGETDALDRVVGLLALRGRTDEATSILRSRRDAGDRVAANRLATIAGNAADGGRAAAPFHHIDDLPEFPLDDAAELEDLADDLARRGDADALEQRINALESDPLIPPDATEPLRRRLSEVLSARGDAAALRRLADQGDFYAECELLELLASTGDLDGVRARAADPDNRLARDLLIRHLAEAGHIDEALTLSRGRVSGPDLGTLTLASVLLELGRIEEAIDLLRGRAARKGWLGASDLADFLAFAGRVDEAVTLLRAHVDNGDDGAEEQLIGTLAAAGRLDEAVSMLRSRADEGDQDAEEMLVDLLDRHGRRDEAIAMLRAHASVGNEWAHGKLAALLGNGPPSVPHRIEISPPDRPRYQRPLPEARPTTLLARAVAPVLLLAGFLELSMAMPAYPELLTVPVALTLLVHGLTRLRRRPYLSSWSVYGPGLVVGLAPSWLLLLVGHDDVPRQVGLAVAAILAMIWGVNRRLQAPLLIGVVVGVLVVVRLLAALWPPTLPLALTAASTALVWAILRPPAL